MAGVGLLLLGSCGDSPPPPPESRPDTAVEQPAFTPRRAPTVAPPSSLAWAITNPPATPSPTATPATPTAAATPAAPSPTPDPTPTATPPPTAPPAPQVSPTATAEPEPVGPNQAAFVQVGTGENHACAVRSDGSAQCWGGNDQDQVDLPSGVKFRQIASGWRFSCGITMEGTLVCWGRNNYQQADPPDGQFTEVSAGWDHACAIGPGGAVCWGRESNDRTSVPEGVTFTAIGAGAEHSCGLTADGDLSCWGKNDDRRAESRPGPFRALAVGVAHTCVLRDDGTALCQGQSDDGQSDPPATMFAHISAGSDRTCGTLPSGQVECWDARPTDAPLETFGPPGALTSVSVGWRDACGINEVGQVACWSSEPDSLPEPYSRLLVANALPDMELAQPVELFPWPHGGLAVVDRVGSIAVLSPEFGSRAILDMTDVVESDLGESGMLSAAIDPDFERSPFLYVFYIVQADSVDDQPFGRLSRFPVADGIAVRDEELIILDLPRPPEWRLHWGGAVRFGPDGMLHLGIGDGHCRECPQSLESLHGKIIRIDVRGASADHPYRIPADNPLLDTPGARPEIWAFGLRNPWRMAFDSQDGTLWVGDVGAHDEEEISIVTAGANLAWPVFEGFRCRETEGRSDIDPRFAPALMCQDLASFTMPVISYRHSSHNERVCAIVGGPVYRGASIPSLDGVYLFGDVCLGKVWALESDAEPGQRLIEIAHLDRLLSSFGIDGDGEVVMATFGGSLVRLVQTELGYAPSVTHRARVTNVGAPLDTRIVPTFGDREP